MNKIPLGPFPDFDACLAHMTKPKSEGGGGYDEETARKVCGKMQAKLGESFSWAGSIEEMPGVDNLIRGKALHPIKTYHYEEWPEVREYLEEELEKSAHTLKGKPLILDHFQVLPGKVLGAEYEDGAIEYVAQLNDPGVMELIRNGAIKHVSVEFEWKSLEQVNGLAPRGINFTGLSLLRLFQPGDPMSSVEVWEGIIKQLKEGKNVRRGVNPAPAQFGIKPASGDTGVMRLSKQTAGEPKTDKERFMAHFGVDEEAFQKFYDLLGDELFKLLPQTGGKTAKEQGNDDNGEREKLRQAQKERAEKYGISPKEGGHLTKPSEYEDVPEDKFADPVNYRYPVTEKYVKGALTYFNQPDNRKAGGYTHEEAVKIMTTIIKAALNAGTEVSWQPEDPVYRDLPEELKKKLTGYEESSQTATEQQGEQEPEKDEHGCVIGKEKWDADKEKCVAITAEAKIAFLKTVLKLKEQELTEEEIKQKIIDLTKQQEELRNKLYPEAELSEEEKVAIQAQIDALYAELQAYEQALVVKIAGQATPPEETPAKPETAGEAIIPSETPQPVCVVPVEKLEGIMPSLQAERSMSYGSQRFVQEVKKLIHEARNRGNA